MIAPAFVSYLRGAAKGMRRVVPVEWISVPSYADLLAEREPSILRLSDSAALPRNNSLLFPELANEEILETHSQIQAQLTDLGIACFHDVVVSGASLVGTTSRIYMLHPFGPRYVDERIRRDWLSNALPVGGRRLARKVKRRVPGVSVLLTHWNSGVYGHWLVENMPNLLLLRDAAPRLPSFQIVLPQWTPTWILDWIRFVIPAARIDLYDNRTEYLQCEMLLLPSLMHPDHYFHPRLSSFLDGLCQASAPGRGPHHRLYVSRLNPSRFRNLSNQAEIENIATGEGLTVVRPETMPIAEQIALFASAEILVGEFGSAMHNALFSRPSTKIFCLNWINYVQSRIAQLRRHDVGYLLPSDGQAVKYVEGAPSAAYHIEPATFRKYLRILVNANAQPE